METLEEFLSGHRKHLSFNAYVTEPGFVELYVRKASRFLNGARVECLDIGRVTAEHPGQGTFTKLAEALLARGIPLYVECVHNERFASKLERMGFTKDTPEGAPSFYKIPLTLHAKDVE